MDLLDAARASGVGIAFEPDDEGWRISYVLPIDWPAYTEYELGAGPLASAYDLATASGLRSDLYAKWATGSTATSRRGGTSDGFPPYCRSRSTREAKAYCRREDEQYADLPSAVAVGRSAPSLRGTPGRALRPCRLRGSTRPAGRGSVHGRGFEWNLGGAGPLRPEARSMPTCSCAASPTTMASDCLSAVFGRARCRSREPRARLCMSRAAR